MRRPIGVGVLGAGAATQAIHLPTLARLGDLFRVVGVMDVDADLAAEVAASASAEAVATEEELLTDRRIDCVLICTPNSLHARQVIASIDSGAKAVLCEKPLAKSAADARAVADAAARSGVPILVGTMHLFDPGWTAVQELWADQLQGVHTVRSTILLPPNAEFEDAATELAPRHRPSAPSPGPSDDALLRAAILGLAVHDLPLVRRLAGPGAAVAVRTASLVPPLGYVVDARVGSCSVLLTAGFSPGVRPRWTLDAYGPATAVRMDFPPSYVHAGSAVATLTSGGVARTLPRSPVNGYEREWLAIAEILQGRRPAPDPYDILADLTFALDIADQAAGRLRAPLPAGGVAPR